MSESTVGKETTLRPVESTRRLTTSRAPLWRNVLLALGIAVGGLAVNEVFNQPTTEQRNAEAALNDPKIPKKTFRVVESPDVEALGGLAVRNRSQADTPGEPPPSRRLPPGYEIKNAIFWSGSADTSTQPGTTGLGWVTFKDEKTERAMFASSDYLEEVKDPSAKP